MEVRTYRVLRFNFCYNLIFDLYHFKYLYLTAINLVFTGLPPNYQMACQTSREWSFDL